MNPIDFRRSRSEQLISLIQSGNAPWQKDGVGRKRPYNAVTNRAYMGANALFLSMKEEAMPEKDPRWCTFKQARNQNWTVKQGEKATIVEYWNFKDALGYEQDEKKKEKEIPRAFYINLFHASQIEGIPTYTEIQVDMDAEIQRILELSGVDIQHNNEGKMAYLPRQDRLLLPQPESFPTMQHYYAAALRGMTIWASHSSQLGSSEKSGAYASAQVYLRIQLANWYITANMNLPFVPRNNYKMDTECIAMLRANPNEIFRAAKDAEKIATYIMELGKQEEIQQEIRKEADLLIEQGKVKLQNDNGAIAKSAVRSTVDVMDLFQSLETNPLPVKEEKAEAQSNESLLIKSSVVKSELMEPDHSIKEKIEEVTSHGGQDDAGGMDTIAIRQRDEDQRFQSGTFGGQPPEVPTDGTDGGFRRTDQENLAGERIELQGADRSDTDRLSNPGERQLPGSLSAPDESGTDDSRTDQRGIDADPARLTAEGVEYKTLGEKHEKNRNNFRIDDCTEIGQGGPKKKFENNIAAIRLLKEIEQEDRKAIAEEQKILALYSGWGALAQAFSYDYAWRNEAKELRELLTPTEYAAAKGSILNAHYTSREVVHGMWRLAERLGFKGGRVLEPSMGVGHFFGLMPEDMVKNSELYGVELDEITGRIARQLYPDAGIEIVGFEKSPMPDNFYDLAISNVPFGNYKVHDPRYDKSNYNIHNYFFAKAMDKVRPGGLVLFVTSIGTMDSGSDSELLRRKLSGKADLVGAIRLPNTAFKRNAGTEVTTDIVILQKRINEKIPAPYAKPWQQYVPSGVLAKNKNREIEMNEYYAEYPDHMIGNLIEDTLYSGGRLALDGKEVDLETRLNEIIETFPQGIYNKARRQTRIDTNIESTKKFLAPSAIRERSFFVKENEVYQKRNALAEEITGRNKERIRAFVQVRETLKHLLTIQLESKTTEAEIKAEQGNLGIQYDAFVKKHGYMNADQNSRLLCDDPEFGMIAAIESYKVDKKSKTVTCYKRDIFTKRTVGAVREIAQTKTASDALATSLAERGCVDLPYMAKLLQQEETKIIQSLKEYLYHNPVTRNWETADEYLSGNVREKLVIAKTAAQQDAFFQKNIVALEEIQPKRLEAEDITIGLGMSWIPVKDIKAFANYLAKENNAVEITYNAPLGTWIVGVPVYSNVKASVAGTQTWGTERMSLPYLLSDALNKKTPTIFKSDPFDDKKRIVDQKATEVANDKLERIKKEFETWIWTDKARTERLVEYYNQNYNNWRLREFDGSHLTLPGYNLLAPQLNKHQKDAVWRIMQEGSALLAHCVGAGKTWTMQTAGMEMRRMGLCKKPLYVIPSPLIEQFEKEFREIYPTAKLLTVSSDKLPDVKLITRKGTSKEELEEKQAERNAKRQEMLARIAMEDWDGIIISHDMFKRIPLSPEYYNSFYKKQLDQLEEAVLELQSATEDRTSMKRVMKDLEKAKKNLEARLERSVNEEKKDVAIPFEKLGIDQIFVDEADLFKNLYFPTKMGRISGLSNSDAQRSMDMFVKTQYLSQKYNNRGIVFATGTPISNTMAEMFTMMRYLDMENLTKNGLDYFDNWASQFAKVGASIERSPDGNGYRKVMKVTSFVNAPEMIKMFRKFADVKQADELNLKRPRLKNGQRTVVSIEANPILKDYITTEIFGRAKAIRGGIDPREDNMLKLTSDLRKASLDMRLIEPNIPAEEANGKLQVLVEKVLMKYEESMDFKGTQMIFCDLSTPKGASDKDDPDEAENIEFELGTENEKDLVIYDQVKVMLQRMGIPGGEIAFIHDAKNKTQKLRLIEDVNEGKIRILLGSTGKLGAGTNAQKRLVALHHVDCPWRPRDIEQREGRILRQGNMNEEVEIFTYVTKGSFDANMWEKIKNKAMIITQAMSNNLVQRKIEDMDAAVLSYAEAEALASGNPLMAEKTMVDAEVIKYSMLQGEFIKQQRENERRLTKLPEFIQNAEVAIGKIKKDIEHRIPILSDRFHMKIGDRVYTKRTDADQALDSIKTGLKLLESTKVGEIAGFDLELRVGFEGTSATLVGGYTYEARSSTVRSIEYCAMEAPEKFLVAKIERLHLMQKEMADIQEIIKQPFQEQEKLEELLKRQNEINQEIECMTEDYPDETYIKSVDEILPEDSPEVVYEAYVNKIQIDNPSISLKNVDRYVVRSLNKAGYHAEKIKECIACSENLKDMEAVSRRKKIDRIVEAGCFSRAI